MPNVEHMRSAIEEPNASKKWQFWTEFTSTKSAGITKDSGSELLTNSSFEGGTTTSVTGWEMAGKPKIDRTGKILRAAGQVAL